MPGTVRWVLRGLDGRWGCFNLEAAVEEAFDHTFDPRQARLQGADALLQGADTLLHHGEALVHVLVQAPGLLAQALMLAIWSAASATPTIMMPISSGLMAS